MTAKSRSNLKAVFENGDSPQGSDFEDLIDSSVSLTDTSAQSLASNLTAPGLAATTVSAGTMRSDGVLMHRNSYAEAYVAVTAITTVAATATWVGVTCAGPMTLGNVSRFSVSGHDLIYTDTIAAYFSVEIQLDARASANQNTWLAIAQNGGVLARSISQRRMVSTDVAPWNTRAVMELQPGETVNAVVQTPDGPIDDIEAHRIRYFIQPVHFD